MGGKNWFTPEARTVMDFVHLLLSEWRTQGKSFELGFNQIPYVGDKIKGEVRLQVVEYQAEKPVFHKLVLKLEKVERLWRISQALLDNKELEMSTQKNYKFVDKVCPHCIKVLGDFEGHEHQYVLCLNRDHVGLDMFWPATPFEGDEGFGHSVQARWFIPKEGMPTIYRCSISGDTEFFCHPTVEGKVVAAAPVVFPDGQPYVPCKDEDVGRDEYIKSPIYIEGEGWVEDLPEQWDVWLFNKNLAAITADERDRLSRGELSLMRLEHIDLMEELLNGNIREEVGFPAFQSTIRAFIRRNGEVPEFLIRVLQDENQVRIRRNAAATLLWDFSSEVSEQVAFALNDPDSEVRSLVIRAMRHSLPEKLIPWLQWLASNDEEIVREEAAFTLGDHCPKACLNDRSYRVRGIAEVVLRVDDKNPWNDGRVRLVPMSKQSIEFRTGLNADPISTQQLADADEIQGGFWINRAMALPQGSEERKQLARQAAGQSIRDAWSVDDPRTWAKRPSNFSELRWWSALQAPEIRMFFGQEGEGTLFQGNFVAHSHMEAVVHTNGTSTTVWLRWFEFQGKHICLANWAVAWKNEGVERKAFVMLEGVPETYGPFDHFVQPDECQFVYR